MCKGPEVGMCFMHLWMTRGPGRKGDKVGPVGGGQGPRRSLDFECDGKTLGRWRPCRKEIWFTF